MHNLSDHQMVLWSKFGDRGSWVHSWNKVPNVLPKPLSTSIWAMLSTQWGAEAPISSEIGTEWRDLILSEMKGLPEVKALHKRVGQDPWATSVAHGVLMSAIGPALPPWDGVVKPKSAVLTELQGLTDLQVQGVAVTTVLGGLSRALGVLGQEAKRFMDEVTWRLPEIRNAIRDACEKSVEELDHLALLEGTIGGGWGIGSGITPTPADIQSRKDRAKMIGKGAHKLNRILEMAGRMLRVAERAQLSKMDSSVGEIVGVRFSDDMEGALPEELGRLISGGDIETSFWVDFVERSVMSYQCEDRVPVAKGPVVYLVDESGSMEGDREEWAKAIALVLASICRKQKRDLMIITFDRIVQDTIDSHQGEISNEMLAWLESKCSGGGTRYEPALDYATELIMESEDDMKHADIIFVTDDTCAVGEQWLNEWRLRKQSAGFPNVVGLGIDCEIDSLITICDSVESVETTAMGAESAFFI